jgi:hypothetical protein
MDLMACVGGVWVSVDSAWEKKKTEARKMPENAQTPTRRVHAVLGFSVAMSRETSL